MKIVSIADSQAVVTSAVTTLDSGMWRSTLWDDYTTAELFVNVLMSHGVNTTTWDLEVSPDGTNWFNHATSNTVFPSMATDTTSYTSTDINGRFWRVKLDPENTNRLTVTLKALYH